MEYGFIISGPIGKSYDWWNGIKGTTAGEVKAYLDAHKNEEVDIAITSPGGYVDHGLVIGQYIKDHGKVTCHIMGMSASIATVLAMSAKKVTMAAGSLMLIHQASTNINLSSSANSDEIKQVIDKLKKECDDLDSVDKVIASIYSQKNKKSVQENLDKMREAKWLTPEDALEFGLIDEIRDNEDDKKKCASVSQKFANIYNSELPPYPGGQQKGKLEKTIDTLCSVFKIAKNATMKKKFTAFMAVLALAELEFKEGKTTLTETQVENLDKELGRLNKELEECKTAKDDAEKAKVDMEKEKEKLDSECEKLKKQVKNLQETSEKHTVVTPAAEEKPVTVDDMYNAIKDLL